MYSLTAYCGYRWFYYFCLLTFLLALYVVDFLPLLYICKGFCFLYLLTVLFFSRNAPSFALNSDTDIAESAVFQAATFGNMSHPFYCLLLSVMGCGLCLFQQTQPESLQLGKWNLITLDVITARLISNVFLCVFLA